MTFTLPFTYQSNAEEVNALHKSQLEARKLELVNQYYGPDMQSQIDNRNALTSKIPYEIEHQKLENKYYAQNILSEIGARGASAALASASTREKNFWLNHPDLMVANAAGGAVQQAATIPYLSQKPLPGTGIPADVQMAMPQNPANNINTMPQMPGQVAPQNAFAMSDFAPQNPIAQNQNALTNNLGNLDTIRNQPAVPAVSPQSLVLKAQQADIDSKLALANQRNNKAATGGGSRYGVGRVGTANRATDTAIAAVNPGLDEDQLIQARDAYAEAGDDEQVTLPDGTILAPITPSIRAGLDARTLATNTAGGLKQQSGAAILDKIITKADPVAEKAFQFAGAVGNSKRKWEGVKAQFSAGKADPGYLAYLQMKNQFVPAMAAEIMRVSGAGSTDTQKALALQETMNENWDTNPALAKKQWEQFKDLYKGISDVAAQSPSEIQGGLRNHKKVASDNPPGTTIMYKGGKVFHIPDEKVAAAQQAGYVNG